MTSEAKPDMILLSTSVQKELQRVAAAATYNIVTQTPFATVRQLKSKNCSWIRISMAMAK